MFSLSFEGELIAESAHRFFISCETCFVRESKPQCVYETCTTSLKSDVYCSQVSKENVNYFLFRKISMYWSMRTKTSNLELIDCFS